MDYMGIHQKARQNHLGKCRGQGCKDIKIGLVTKSYPPGIMQGGPRSAELLVEELRDKGFDVEVLCFSAIPDDKTDPGYVKRVENNIPRNDLLQAYAYSSIRDFAKDKDILHSYNRIFDPIVALEGEKTVSTLNNFMFDYPRDVPGKEVNPSMPLYRRIYNSFCRHLTGRIGAFGALSPQVKEFYSDTFSRDKIEVIQNMYDPEFPESYDIATNENEILYVGAIKPRKGVSELIDQFEELPEKYSLRIVGDGPQKEKLESKVSGLGIDDRVDFEGFIDHDELPKYYERAGIFVHPGQWPEPFGRTILEAMQMETPVIATNRGGPKYTLAEEQLIDSMNQLSDKLENFDKGKAVREQNRRLESYSPEEVTSRYVELYRDLLEDN